jgi:hypothetical protein
MNRFRTTSAYVLPRRRQLQNGIALGDTGRERMLEPLCVVAIVAVLVAFALASYFPTVKRFMLTEASNLTGPYKDRMVEAMAVRGVMPQTLDTGAMRARVGSSYFDDLAWQDGEVVFTLGARTAAGMLPESAPAGAPPLTLSYRFARTDTGNRLVLICGLAEPPPGFTAAPARHTTVPAEFLPAHCRI